MRRTFMFVPAFAFLLLLAATGPVINDAGASGKPQADTPVTTVIEGLGVDTSPTLRIQSDQVGPYKNSSTLQSIIQGIGDWVLDTLNYTSSPQRKVLIDLREPVPGSGPNGGAPIAPFAFQQVRARFISKCSQYGGNMRTIPAGSTIYCPLAVAFDDASGVRYRLSMHADTFPEVNLVQVTCVATDATSKCNQWKIEPSATQLDGERKNVAKLLKVATKPRQADQDMGDFYMSFVIHVTNP